MAEITATSYVTRAALSLGNLTIENKNDSACPYTIGREGIGPGAVTWRRNTVESPFVHGRYLVNRVMDTPQMNLSLRVKGASWDWCDYYVKQLIDAFSQFYYILSLTVDGVTHQWLCESADFTVGNGGQFQDLHMRSYQQEVKFVIPRYPTPFSGRY